MTTATENSFLVLDDLDKPIRGAKAIRAARGNVQTLQQTFYGLEHGTIAAIKRGRIWETTLRRLKGDSSAGPTADNGHTSSIHGSAPPSGAAIDGR